MSKADVKAGSAFVEIFMKDSLTRGLNAAKANLNKFGSDMMALGAKVATIGGTMVAPLAASVSVASDFEEAFSKFSVVFGKSTDDIKKWSDEFANAVGRSKLQVVEFMASSQDLFVPIGFEPGAAENLSKQLTTLAVDLASFNNMADADTLRDLHAALTGSGEVMKKYGVLVSEAAVKQELLNQAIDPASATEMQKVQARLNIIMRGTTAAQGDAIRTAGSFANQVKALKGTLTDLGVELGSALLPSLSTFVKVMADGVKQLIAAAQANPDLVMSFVAVSGAVAATGAAIIGVGVAAKISAAVIGVVGTAYRAAAIVASVAWSAVRLAFAVLTIKATVSAAVASAAWSVASQVIAASWKILGTVLSAAVSTAVFVSSALIIASAWIAAAAVISVAVFGLGTVMTTTSAIATAAWSAAGGIVTAAWVASSAAIATSWAAMSGSVSALAGIAIGSWISGAGIAGTAMAVLSAAYTMAGGTGAVSAAISGGAWSAAGALASLSWSAFTAVIGAVFTASNLLTVAAFAVSTAWAAAWAVVSGPILPIVAALALIAAAIAALTTAAAVATLQGVDFSGAWTRAKEVLSELMAVAKRVGGILMTALGGGDYDIAFRAAMAGIKITFATFIEVMADAWSEFWSSALDLAKAFMMNFGSITLRVVNAISSAMSNPISGALTLKNAMSDLANSSFDIKMALDTEGMKTAANAELDALEKELADRKAKRDAETAAKAKQDAAAGGGEPNASGDPHFSAEDIAILNNIDQDTVSNFSAIGDGADKASEAFDRETEAIQRQIVALREGAEAAEAMRLKQAGLSDEEIAKVQSLQAEQKALEKQNEESQRRIGFIQDFADADAKKGTSSEEVARKEKAAIELKRQQGLISDQAAKEAKAQADIRKVERDHQAALQKFSGEDAGEGGSGTSVKSGKASAATFSAASLIQMGRITNESKQTAAIMATKKAIEAQTIKQKELSDKQIEAYNKNQLMHP